MQKFNVKTLTKSRGHVRLAIFAPTGGGKTFTALTLARGLTDGKILVRDTEHRTAGLYAEELNYDKRIDVIDDETKHDPEQISSFLQFAAQQGYECVILDSWSHTWEDTLGEVDKAAARSKSNNGFAAWKEVTPLHNKMVNDLLDFPGHVIVTMRVKMEYIVENVGGKSVPRKVGLAPKQKEGIEYEFDFCAEMDQENNFLVTKTRASRFRGFAEKRPGDDLARRLRDWAEEGVVVDLITDPKAAWLRYNPDQRTNAELKELAESAGLSYSSVVVDAYNGGARGIVGLRSFIEDAIERSKSGAAEVPAAEQKPAAETPAAEEVTVANLTPEELAYKDCLTALEMTPAKQKLYEDAATNRSLPVIQTMLDALEAGTADFDELMSYLAVAEQLAASGEAAAAPVAEEVSEPEPSAEVAEKEEAETGDRLAEAAKVIFGGEGEAVSASDASVEAQKPSGSAKKSGK